MLARSRGLALRAPISVDEGAKKPLENRLSRPWQGLPGPDHVARRRANRGLTGPLLDIKARVVVRCGREGTGSGELWSQSGPNE